MRRGSYKNGKILIRMRLISWNVNGLRACEGKGFSEVFKSLDADFFCLQETKRQDSSTFSSKAMSLTGTMPTKKDIPALPYSQG